MGSNLYRKSGSISRCSWPQIKSTNVWETGSLKVAYENSYNMAFREHINIGRSERMYSLIGQAGCLLPFLASVETTEYMYAQQTL